MKIWLNSFVKIPSLLVFLDGILIPAPYYYGFDSDFTLQAEAVCYPVDLLSQVVSLQYNAFQHKIPFAMQYRRFLKISPEPRGLFLFIFSGLIFGRAY